MNDDSAEREIEKCRAQNEALRATINSLTEQIRNLNREKSELNDRIDKAIDVLDPQRGSWSD